jgi:UDP-2,4-diacetamido-2,4,6-trideoxy-beta-L-altropyranose hydrolase
VTTFENLLIRCDASVPIGTGHVMRCLALAQAWQDAGGRAIFAMAETTPAIEERIRGEKMSVLRVAQPPGSSADAVQTCRLGRQASADWVVVDGYVFGADYQANLHEAGLRILVVDDHGRAGRYSVDIVLNQNPNASEDLYVNREPSTQLLLRLEYALLRREFSNWKQWKRDTPGIARNLLVMMGGTDPENVTQRVLDSLAREPDFEIQVVAGGSNPHLDELRESVRKPGAKVRLVEKTVSMPELMAWADIAVSAAGTTAWEMAFMGLPALLIILADNQEPIAGALDDAGAALSLGQAATLRAEDIRNHLRSLAASHEVLGKMSTCGRALIDGRGAERAVAVMLERKFDTTPMQRVFSRNINERS